MTMNYSMFGVFTLIQNSECDFTLEFQIPDNCSYVVNSVDDVFDLAVKLNPGQSAPSARFNNCKEEMNINGRVLTINVCQHEKSGTVIKRPTVIVNI